MWVLQNTSYNWILVMVDQIYFISIYNMELNDDRKSIGNYFDVIIWLIIVLVIFHTEMPKQYPSKINFFVIYSNKLTVILIFYTFGRMKQTIWIRHLGCEKWLYITAIFWHLRKRENNWHNYCSPNIIFKCSFFAPLHSWDFYLKHI